MYQPSGGAQPRGQQRQFSSRSPPPLQHPVPTHPPFQVPDPPVTPGPAPHGAASSSGGSSSGGYARYASPPPAQPQHAQHMPPHQQYAQPQQQHYDYSAPHQAHAQMHHGQQGQQPAFPAFPTFAAFGPGPQGQGQQGQQGMQMPMLNDATAQMGMQFGKQMGAAGQEYVRRNFGSLLPLPLLKHYFNVSNSYVLHKLRLVLFPWRHRPWSRAHAAAAAGAGGAYDAGAPGKSDGYAPPREDVNSPDLYIPVMAFVTYVLLVCVIRGLSSRFHPEVLGVTGTRALLIVFLEFALVKLGCYLLNIQGDHTVVDLVAYGGYKFVGAIVTLAVGMCGVGRLLYWGTFAYTCAANAFFLLRSLRYVVLPDPSNPSSVTITQAQRSRRIQFLFSIAMAQTLFCFLLIIGIWK
ncbi:YIF1-domain-containing protein [Tilletiopsis washingtonensis]|uniref:YIF1-domain-containing protein n=1 Tax=Tilletiopsis washingtonensis TaxID=58919 RepID=A0A316ZKL2_9BASI|nr:YIF1-domain-containing protein [Tilletiopsis washingtonensis]PWO00926.1 YIF1-domain-containing protein [Tilletiopsis washingtonensis]